MSARRNDTIRLSTQSLENIHAQLSQLSSRLSEQISEISSIASRITEASGSSLNVSLNVRLSNSANVRSGDVQTLLANLSRALRDCDGESGRIMKSVNTVQSMFTDNENKIISAVNAISLGDASKFASGGSSGTVQLRVGSAVQTNGTTTRIDWRLDDLLKSLVTSLGMAGSFFYSLATAGTPAGLAKFLATGVDTAVAWKDIVKGFGKLKNFGTSYAVKTYAKKIFGFQSYANSMGFTISKANTAFGRFTSNLSRSGAFAKGMTSVVSWITEGIDKGIENYQEYAAGYKSAGTAIAEWGTETTLGVAATAGTIAVIGAAIPAAPAVLIAATGGVVVWGVDTLWANTLGKGMDEGGGNEGLIETLGETIVDGGKYVIDQSARVIDDVGSFVNDNIEKAKGFFTNGLKISVDWAR